jgi:hypothetical protein
VAHDETPSSLRGLLGALGAATSWLDACGVRFAVVGGVAASLYGKPRVTKDVDLVAMAEDDTWASLVERAARWNLAPRIADVLDFAKTTRVLLLVHEPSRIEVDVSFGMLPFERELVERAATRTVRRVTFPIASPEDILVMKALALRPRDVADIEGILQSVPSLDLERVRAMVALLSAALETDDHLAALDRIIAAERRRTSR